MKDYLQYLKDELKFMRKHPFYTLLFIITIIANLYIIFFIP